MTKYYIKIWANSGDKLPIPNDAQSNGSVSYQEGYGADYQIPDEQDPDFKDIERLEYNQSLFDITENIQQYQQHGVPNFITTSDNEGVPFPYDKFAFVLFTDGNVYISLETANEDTPPSNKWRIAPNGENVVYTEDLIGEIKSFAYAPATSISGFLYCDGSEVSRTTFADLFSKIGTTWGVGDTSTTFNLPDFRGQFLRGYDDDRGVDPGRVFGDHQELQVSAHKHNSAWGEDNPGPFGSTTTNIHEGSEATDFNNFQYYTNDGSEFDSVNMNPLGLIGDDNRPVNETVSHYIRFR